MNRPFRILVVHRTPHHAAMSGRSAGSELLRPDVTVDGLGPSVPFTVAWALSRVSIGDEFTTLAFQREAEVLRTGRRLAGSGGASVHYLSAEHDAKYIPQAAARLGWYTSAWFHKPPDQLRRLLDRRRSLHRLDRAWAISATQVPILESYLGPERVGVAPHGVDTDHFVPPAEPDRARSVLFVGSHLRDFDQLRRVYLRLAKLDPSIDLRVVLPSHVLDEVPGVPGTILADIPDDALLAEYQRAGVVFLPLLGSTANVSLLEAMACACPIVVTDVGGVGEYAGDTAVLVDPGDDDAAVEAVRRQLDDIEPATGLGQRARARSLQFSFATMGAAFTWAGDPPDLEPAPTGLS